MQRSGVLDRQRWGARDYSWSSEENNPHMHYKIYDSFLQHIRMTLLS